MGQLQLTKEQQDIVNAKSNNWAKQGALITRAEFWLSGEVNSVRQRIESLTISKENVPFIEEEVKEITKKIKEMQAQRMKITNPLDGVKKRLSQFEKDSDALLNGLKSGLLGLKKEIKAEQEAKQRIEQQKIDFAHVIKVNYDALQAKCEARVETLVHSSYSQMLKEKQPLDKFDSIVENVVQDAKFPTMKDQMEEAYYDVSLLTADEIKAIKKENVIELPDYKALLKSRLMDKKVTYQAELNDVEEALKQQELEKQERIKKAEYEAKSKELQAKIEKKKQEEESKASIEQVGKDLKETYEVDMPETPETALHLWACFQGNFDEVMKHLKVNKWFSCTPKQIATALGKIKSKDNRVTFSNINFKKVEKL